MLLLFSITSEIKVSIPTKYSIFVKAVLFFMVCPFFLIEQ